MQPQPEQKQTMRALVFRAGGAPADVLKLESGLPVPSVGAGQVLVLVKVSHFALNPTDHKRMMNLFAMHQKHVPGCGVIPCEDFAGTVVASQSPAVAVGEEVVGYVDPSVEGAAAEFIAVPASAVIRRPRALSAEQAASYPLVAITAHTALTKQLAAAVRPDCKLLVLGGASACGAFALQWATRVLGVRAVATTCSAASAARVRDFGADRIIDYQTQHWWEVLRGEQFDAILDCIGGHESWQHAGEVLKAGGTFATLIGDYAHDNLSLGMLAGMVTSTLARKLQSLFGGPRYELVMLEFTRARFEALAAAFDGTLPGQSRPLTTYVARVFPVAQFADAFALQQSTHAKGKVVVAW